MSAQHKRPWLRAVLWLCFLGPYFAITYGWANSISATKSNVGEIVFAWEQHIPFLPWTIFFYWFIDIMYGFSFFMAINKRELDSHGLRLFTAQTIAVICFILFPLTYSTTKPETSGLTGTLFDVLQSFDEPFNQTPSLHIAILVILWSIFNYRLPKVWRWPLHVITLAIAISVLTTYQHHFIDVPTGALLGLLCIWLWPFEGECPLSRRRDGSKRIS